MVTSHQDPHKSFSAKLLPSPSIPYCVIERDYSSPGAGLCIHLSLLNFIRFLLASCAHLNPPEWQPFNQQQCQIHFIWPLESVSRKAAENEKYTQILYKKEDSELRQLPIQICQECLPKENIFSAASHA